MEALLRQLFAAHYRDLYRYLYSMTRDAALSEELASETFLEAVRSIGSFRGQSDLKTWLFSIARHRWARHLRKNRPEVGELPEVPDPGQDLEGLVLDREAARRALELLALEPERTQKVVRLRLAGWSFQEIGRACGLSESSARVTDFRARNKIKTKLKEEGYRDE